MIDTASLHERISGRAEDFVRTLFDERAKRCGPVSWRVGKYGSLAIHVRDGSLVFYDHEADSGGDCVALWQRERGGTNGEALRACAGWAELNDDASPLEPAPSPRPAPTKAARVEIPQIPEHAFNAWHEGRKWLSGNAAVLGQLAAWRKWPLAYVEILSRAGIIAAPICYRERARIAFKVATPEPWPTGGEYPPEHAHRDRARFVGFHARVKDRDGKHRGWRYVPKRDDEPATARHSGLPPLPLVLSCADSLGQVWAARLLIVTEGEFDALTIPLALGWFDEALGLLRIPPRIAIVGIAGAGSGPDAFLDAYRFAWPHEATALVLRDSDKAGTKWTKPGEFLDKLRARCARVESCHFGTNPNGTRRDVSDFYETCALTRDLFDALLLQLGISLAEAESTAPPPA